MNEGNNLHITTFNTLRYPSSSSSLALTSSSTSMPRSPSTSLSIKRIIKKAQFNNAKYDNIIIISVPWSQSLTCRHCHWSQETVQRLCVPPTTDSSWYPSCTTSIHYCWLLLPSVSDHFQQNRHQVFHRYTQQTVESHNNTYSKTLGNY